ncbi:hypothetical protein D3C78_1179000 [compost metagenome]
MLSGAWHHTATISRPAAGEWTAAASNSGSGAYLLTVSYDTNGKKKAKLRKERDNKKLKLEIDGLKEESTQITYNIDFVDSQEGKSDKKQRKLTKPKRVEQQDSLSTSDEVVIPTDAGSGVYTVTAEIEGETEEGFKYRRTIVKSVYVDEQGNTYTP